MVGLLRQSFWLILLLASTVIARPLALLPADAIFIDDPEAQALSKQSQDALKLADAAASAGRAAAALDALREIERPVDFELAAAAVIRRLQAGDDSPTARAILFELSQTPVRVFTRHEETAADWFVPVFNIGARARSALRLFDHRLDIAHWKALLESDPDAAMRALAQQAGEAPKAAAAVAELGSNESLRLSERLLAAKSLRLPSIVARELALKTADRRWFDHVAQFGAETDQLALIGQTHVLQSDDAMSWLLAFSDDHEVGSAALLALARYADAGTPALARLIGALDDQRLGPSAAMALASRPQADRLDVLSDLSQQPDLSSRALGRLALALRLEGSSAATELLDVLAQRTELPDAVRQELNR